jgi:hypothetical protein
VGTRVEGEMVNSELSTTAFREVVVVCLTMGCNEPVLVI